MNRFNYILEKIKNAEIVAYPYMHIEISDLLNEEDLELILKDKQVHFPKVSSIDSLYDTLIKNKYSALSGAGVTESFSEYKDMLENDKGILGMGFHLVEPESLIIKELVSFFRSNLFHECLRAKFSLTRKTRLYSDLRKYLSRYQISPHPDVRVKAATFLLNINAPEASSYDIHTKMMVFKDEYKYKYEEWQQNKSKEREWVPWEWCREHKSISRNNSIIIFSPNDFTLHAVKLDYPHLEFQRTQIYGNLWYN